MPKLPTNLARIGAVYKFRVRVPKDLLEQYAPKREIVQSLKTKDLAEARRRLPAVQQHYQDEWERLRQRRFEAQLSDAPFVLGRAPLKPKPIDQELIDYATSLLAHDSLAGDEQTRLAGNYTLEEINEYRTGLAEAITQLRDMVSTGDTQPLLPSALQLLQFKGIEAQGSEEDYRRLALAFARSAIQTNEQLLQQLSGNVVEPTPVKVPRTLREARVPVYSLFTYWRDLVAGRSRQTVDDFEREIRAFEDVVGDKSADELTKADLIAYRDMLLATCKASSTVGKRMSFVKAMLQAAYEAEKIPNNPAALIKIPRSKRPTSARRFLTGTDLTTLFSSKIYTEGFRPEGGAGEAAAWIPLIALYTGFRLEEICQLTLSDVVTSGSIPYFSFELIEDETDDQPVAEKKLKNEESRRSVPIHHRLIAAGFLDYVAYQRERNARWLFPDLKPNVYGKRGGNFAKWWIRWRRTIGVGGAHRCLHAMRHAFKTACRGAGLSEETHDALTGHSGGGVGRDYGNYPLKGLNAAIQKVEYEDFELNWRWSADGLRSYRGRHRRTPSVTGGAKTRKA